MFGLNDVDFKTTRFHQVVFAEGEAAMLLRQLDGAVIFCGYLPGKVSVVRILPRRIPKILEP